MPEENININVGDEETEGQLAIDVYQDGENIYILAPIAGTAPADIDVQITDEVVTIRGERKSGHKATDEMHFVQECYWGEFSRSLALPVSVKEDDIQAQLKDGVLTISFAKMKQDTIKKIQIL